MIDSAWQDVVKERFHDPPTSEERRLHFGQALINKFTTEFEQHSWGSPQFPEMSFHVLFGQLPSIKPLRIKYQANRSDPRVHMILFGRSGSGKGRGFDYTVGIAEQLNLNCLSPDDMKDATLLGSMDQMPGEREPVRVRGILDPRRIPPVNILIQNEATLIIDARKSDLSKNFMNYYQKAMNPIGSPDNRIEKEILRMRGATIRINPDVSFYLTTYPPDKLLETVTKAGFIQRMVMLYNITGFDDRIHAFEQVADKTGKVEGENYTPEIVATLEYINKHYKKNPFIELSQSAIESNTCGEVMRRIYRPLHKVNDAMKDPLADFVPRAYENVIKIAYHHAMCRLSPEVDNRDFGYALSVTMPAWSRLISYMEDSEDMVRDTMRKWDRYKDKAMGIYKQIVQKQQHRGMYDNGWVKRETLVKFLASRKSGWNVSPQTARKRLDKLTTDFKHFEQKTNSRGSKMIRVRED